MTRVTPPGGVPWGLESHRTDSKVFWSFTRRETVIQILNWKSTHIFVISFLCIYCKYSFYMLPLWAYWPPATVQLQFLQFDNRRRPSRWPQRTLSTWAPRARQPVGRAPWHREQTPWGSYLIFSFCICRINWNRINSFEPRSRSLMSFALPPEPSRPPPPRTFPRSPPWRRSPLGWPPASRPAAQLLELHTSISDSVN